MRRISEAHKEVILYYLPNPPAALILLLSRSIRGCDSMQFIGILCTEHLVHECQHLGKPRMDGERVLFACMVLSHQKTQQRTVAIGLAEDE